MKKLAWYVHRLKSMSAREIAWRVSSLLRGLFRLLNVCIGRLPEPDSVPLHFVPRFRLSPIKLQCKSFQPEWKEELLSLADEICEKKLSYFDLSRHDHSEPINWLKDHSANIESSTNHILFVDYRDFSSVGDYKLVWEPNRHHHLVVLARAYRVTGNKKYATQVAEQIESWLQQNPYGKGMNWRSPLELGIRLINWTWAYDLILESKAINGDLLENFLIAVYRHCELIQASYSQGTSANNHLVGEAAGVFVASSYFEWIPEARRWAREAGDILQQEIESQTYKDGCIREHAFCYQGFVIQFYYITGLVASWSGENFPEKFWQNLDRQIEFIEKISAGSGAIPSMGDQDDGYVLNLGDSQYDVDALRILRSALANQPIEKYTESLLWLFGTDQETTTPRSRTLDSKAFSESGYYLLQHGNTEGDSVSLLFDAADLGYTEIAAHGHADALAFILSINGEEVFIDSGTYDYFTYPEWRNYFRSTAAHNTINIDSLDQSQNRGPFMWDKHAVVNLLKWQPSDGGGLIQAEHTGYQRLEDPVLHRRTISVNADRHCVEIIDELICEGIHDISINFHLSELFSVQTQTNGWQLKSQKNQVSMELDERLTCTSYFGDDESKLGWRSHGYHQKQPTNTLCARIRITGTTRFSTQIRWD